MLETLLTYFPYFLLALGVVLGTFVFDIADALIFSYLHHPQTPTAQAFRGVWQTRQLKSILSFWKSHRLGGERYLLHSVLFQPLLILITYFAVFTAGNRLAVGILTGATIVMTIRQFQDYRQWGHLGPWTWPIRGGMSPKATKIYLALVSVASLGLPLFLF